MKIYIAGKYSGLGHANACSKFAHTKQQLITAGVPERDIVNPMEFGIPENEKWSLALDICLSNMKRCDAVIMQFDWRESDGARIEHDEAIAHGLPIFYETQDGILAVAAWYQSTQSGYLVFSQLEQL